MYNTKKFIVYLLNYIVYDFIQNENLVRKRPRVASLCRKCVHLFMFLLISSGEMWACEILRIKIKETLSPIIKVGIVIVRAGHITLSNHHLNSEVAN